MKLFDLIKALGVLIDPSGSFKQLDADISIHDEVILLETIERGISSKNVRIVNCRPNVDINPSAEETISYLNDLVEMHQSLLSEIMLQLIKLQANEQLANEASYVKTSLLARYAKQFIEKFSYHITPDAVGYGYQSAYTAGFKFLKHGLRQKILGLDAAQNIDVRGWKFHISLDDTDDNKTNIANAWNLILDLIYKYQILIAKVSTKEVRLDIIAPNHRTIGKQITIYGNQSDNPAYWQSFFQEVHHKFVNNAIKPGYLAEGDKQVNGSEFVSYRFDTTYENNKKGVDRREEDDYKPENLEDPFQTLRCDVAEQK